MPAIEFERSEPLRVFCLEDNPLLLFHLEQMIEDVGHTFAGSTDSFARLKSEAPIPMDVALVDIDLADGRTGPAAAAWLRDQGVAIGFVTGQVAIAAQYTEISSCVLAKPFAAKDLAQVLDELRRPAE
jgi:DNA-binding LytR/AlgR family response regulator